MISPHYFWSNNKGGNLSICADGRIDSNYDSNVGGVQFIELCY